MLITNKFLLCSLCFVLYKATVKSRIKAGGLTIVKRSLIWTSGWWFRCRRNNSAVNPVTVKESLGQIFIIIDFRIMCHASASSRIYRLAIVNKSVWWTHWFHTTSHWTSIVSLPTFLNGCAPSAFGIDFFQL